MKHINGILKVFQYTLQFGPSRAIFSPPGEVVFVSDSTFYAHETLLKHNE